MAVEQEIWCKYIMNRLFKDNQFLNFAFNDDQYVLAGRVVHIPQPGAKPTVVKNRSSFPAAAVTRTDTDIIYTLNEYTTDPAHIKDAEKYEVSYDKIASVFGDHAGQMVETVADDLLINWLTGIGAGQIVNTSGASAAAKISGQTGTRKVLVHGDLKAAKLKLDLQNIPASERYALLEANAADELFDSLSSTQYRDFSANADAKNGVVGRLYGFDIMVRSNVAIATSANAINPLGTAVGATDNVASIAWHKSAVTRAIGEQKFFEDKNNPLYYGDIYSSLMRMGGRRRRADNAGIVSLIQAA